MNGQNGNYNNPQGNNPYQQGQQPYNAQNQWQQPQQGYPQGQQPYQPPQQPYQQPPQGYLQGQPLNAAPQGAPPIPQPPMHIGAQAKRKKRPGFALGLLAGVLAVAIAGGVLFGAGVLSFGRGGAAGQIEGGGYATGEDAVAAYIEGLAAGDLNAVMAACAVESYVDNFDFAAQLERVRVYQPFVDPRLPVTAPISRQLNIASRQNSLATVVYYQAMTLCAYDAAFYEMVLVELPDDAAIDDFLEVLADEDLFTPLSTMELVRYIGPEVLSVHYSADANRANFDRQAGIYGMDELAGVAAVVEVDGEEWLMCFDVGSYGGKWYVVNAGGNLGALLGVSTVRGGVAPADSIGGGPAEPPSSEAP